MCPPPLSAAAAGSAVVLDVFLDGVVCGWELAYTWAFGAWSEILFAVREWYAGSWSAACVSLDAVANFGCSGAFKVFTSELLWDSADAWLLLNDSNLDSLAFAISLTCVDFPHCWTLVRRGSEWLVKIPVSASPWLRSWAKPPDAIQHTNTAAIDAAPSVRNTAYCRT